MTGPRPTHPRSSPLAALAAGLALAAGAAEATQITVTGTGDTIAVDGFVTLREALTAANTDAIAGDAPAGSGYDTIQFNISGAPGTVHTIEPQSALPTITRPVLVDGYSQLGASTNTSSVGTNAFLAIELDGTFAGFQAGLAIGGGGSTIQGLVIHSFNNEGILVFGAGGNTIRGNFLGTDPTGKLDRGNGVAGISLLSSGNLVGGTQHAHRNLISGNDFAGITLTTSGVTGNHVEGNLIGTDDTGADPLPNNGAGVRVLNVTGNTIGGAAGNVIAFNTGAGIVLTAEAGTGNLFQRNLLHDNGGLEVDLDNDGVTPNDAHAALDTDSGPNGLQNYPELASALVGNAGTTLTGTLWSAALRPFWVELYVSEQCDGSGHGPAASLLGGQLVQTAANGSATIRFTTPAQLSTGWVVTATATDRTGSSSELSACVTVAPAAQEPIFVSGFEGGLGAWSKVVS